MFAIQGGYLLLFQPWDESIGSIQ